MYYKKARADGDGIRRPPGHLIIAAGREEVMRKGGGEEARSVRCMCDVCAAHELVAARLKQRIRSSFLISDGLYWKPAKRNSFGDSFGDFGDFGVSYVATVAWRYTRRGGPRLSVQGEPLVVLTRGP